MRLDSEKYSQYQKWIPAFLQTGIINSFYYLRARVFRGKEVYCNCCSASYSAYLPPYRECPGCGAQARQRLMSFFLENKTDIFIKPHRLLHFAPEASLEKRLRKSANIDYLSADLESHRAMEAIDMTSIPYPEGSFSVILCSHVLEHIPQDLLAMQELYRVLARGGWAIVQVPIDYDRETTYEDFSVTSPQERARLFGRFDHCRVYGRDYKDRLEQAGFDVTVDKYVQTFSAADVEKYGLEIGEKVYVCRKR